MVNGLARSSEAVLQSVLSSVTVSAVSDWDGVTEAGYPIKTGQTGV